MLTFCHVGVGLDVANIAINLVRRFDFDFTMTDFLLKSIKIICMCKYCCNNNQNHNLKHERQKVGPRNKDFNIL